MLTLLIDGLNLVRRVHAAVPGADGSEEHGEGVLRSCVRSVERALSAVGPTHALCAFDDPGTSWRHEILPSYKAGRPSMPQGLARLLPRIRGAFEENRVRTVQVAGCEADDVLATVALGIAARGGTCVPPPPTPRWGLRHAAAPA
jgi:5'-3' exonuclease